MPIEGFTYLSSLDATLPSGTDGLVEGDNHIRGIKNTLKNTFPNLSGPVASTHVALSNPVLGTVPATDTIAYFTSATTAGTTPFTTFGRSLVGAASGAAAQTILGISTNYVPLTGGTISGGVTFGSTTAHNGLATFSGGINVTSAAPAITLVDTNWGNRTVYADGGLAGFLTSGGGWAWYVDNSGNSVSTGNVSAYSDERLKTNIRNIDNALEICGQLRGVRYTKIADDQPSIGVIAQEIEPHLPELVGHDILGLKHVAYPQLVALLINAINELNTKVDKLSAKAPKAKKTTDTSEG